MTFRKFAGLTTALVMIAAMLPLLMAPAIAQDATTCDGLGYPGDNKVEGGGTISGDWGSATWDDDEDTTLELDINEGWTVDICVKAGTELDEFTVDSSDEVIQMGHGISHVSWTNSAETTTTTTEDTTTTTVAETTTTTVAETTTTTVAETTTTTEAETTTTTEADTTTTTEADTTTTTEEEVEGETTTSTTEAEEEVAGETTSTTEVQGETTSTTEGDETEDTLPFTGIGTDGIALAALIALASGAGLIFLTGRSDETQIEG